MNEREALQALRALLGERGFLDGDGAGERYLTDVLGQQGSAPAAVLRPRDTSQVSRALALCHAADLHVVTARPQRGCISWCAPLSLQCVAVDPPGALGP